MNAFPNVFDLPTPESEGSQEGALAPARKQANGRPDLDRFLEDFISGREPQTTQWIRLASMVASQSFSCDVVVRVLRPNEKVASGNLPIDKLGVSIARKVGAKYSPGRLKRGETRMGDFTFDPDRPAESGEEYSFDKAFLPATARILVIGDHETSAPTYEAIRIAIEHQLPKAEVKSFTLYWLEQHFRSASLDGRYFLSSASPLSVLSRQANPHHPAEREPVPAEVAEPIAPVVLEPPVSVEPSVEAVPIPEPVVALQPVARSGEKKPVSPRLPAPKKHARVSSLIALVALGVIVLGVGVVVVGDKTGMFASKAQPSDASVIPEPSEAALAEPSGVQSVPVKPPVVEARPKGPQGIIAVPSSGLRAGPSLDAKPLRKSVRNNERVTILRRKPSNAGPDWLQIETQSGTVGWVWASVVREARRR
jgi:hypothetical protein